MNLKVTSKIKKFNYNNKHANSILLFVKAINDKEFRIAVYPEEQDEENPR